MAARYKNRDFQRTYETMLTLAQDKESELYHNGQQRRGAGHRCAFWDGYNGMKRSANVTPQSQSAVCFQAGKEFAKKNPGVPLGAPVTPFSAISN